MPQRRIPQQTIRQPQWKQQQQRSHLKNALTVAITWLPTAEIKCVVAVVFSMGTMFAVDTEIWDHKRQSPLWKKRQRRNEMTCFQSVQRVKIALQWTVEMECAGVAAWHMDTASAVGMGQRGNK
jgi:hypothetical protein